MHACSMASRIAAWFRDFAAFNIRSGCTDRTNIPEKVRYHKIILQGSYIVVFVGVMKVLINIVIDQLKINVMSERDNILNILWSRESCLGWVEMAVGLSEGPCYPGHPPSHKPFFCCSALQTTAEGQHAASLKLVDCFLSSASHSSLSLNERQRLS